MKLIKEGILNKIQLTAEVNGALVNNDVVVVQKRPAHIEGNMSEFAPAVYDVYGSTGKIDGGKLVEE